jgi:hypothetical protein
VRRTRCPFSFGFPVLRCVLAFQLGVSQRRLFEGRRLGAVTAFLPSVLLLSETGSCSFLRSQYIVMSGLSIATSPILEEEHMSARQSPSLAGFDISSCGINRPYTADWAVHKDILHSLATLHKHGRKKSDASNNTSFNWGPGSNSTKAAWGKKHVQTDEIPGLMTYAHIKMEGIRCSSFAAAPRNPAAGAASSTF